MEHNNENSLANSDLSRIARHVFSEDPQFDFNSEIGNAIESMSLSAYAELSDTMFPEEKTTKTKQEKQKAFQVTVFNKEKQEDVTKKANNTQTKDTIREPQQTTHKSESKTKKRPQQDIRYSLEDPILYQRLIQEIQAREDNKGYPQQLIEECARHFIERHRNKSHKSIGESNLRDIRKSTYLSGRVSHMLKEKEEKRKEEEIIRNGEESEIKKMEARELKRKRMKQYRNDILIDHEEGINPVSHKKTLKITKTEQEGYNIVFKIISTYYKKRFSKQGFIVKKESSIFYFPLKKLLKGLIGTERLTEAATEILREINEGRPVRWKSLEEKYLPKNEESSTSIKIE